MSAQDDTVIGDLLDEERLRVDEDELRRVSAVEGALGQNASDYHNMWTLFTQMVERADAMNENPNAFLTAQGTIDVRALGAWTKMIATAKSILEGLNRMRNDDKMVAHMLDDHTRMFVQDVSISIGMELKGLIDRLEEDGEREHADAVRRILYRRLSEIFLRSAESTLTQAREKFGLVH